MKLTMIRHGDTEATLRRLYYGSTDLPLLPQSAQALEANAALYPKAPRYFTSGMLRTEQTFQTIYGDQPHEILPGLREMDFGRFEMHSYEELKDDPDYRRWCEDSEHLPCPGGEDAQAVLVRSLQAIDGLLEAGIDACGVIHGGVIASLMMHWFGGIRYDYSLAPGQGFTVTFSGKTPERYEKIP